MVVATKPLDAALATHCCGMCSLQHEPKGGIYCIYHRRKRGDYNYNYKHEGAYQTYVNQPDCPGYRETLRRHATQLVAAGIDHVVVSSVCLTR